MTTTTSFPDVRTFRKFQTSNVNYCFSRRNHSKTMRRRHAVRKPTCVMATWSRTNMAAWREHTHRRATVGQKVLDEPRPCSAACRRHLALLQQHRRSSSHTHSRDSLLDSSAFLLHVLVLNQQQQLCHVTSPSSSSPPVTRPSS